MTLRSLTFEMMITKRADRLRWSNLCYLLGALVVAGCKTADVPGGGYTGVIIEGSTRDDIRVAAKTVFEKNGYTSAFVGIDEMVFEKQDGGMSSLAYGTWMSMAVWTRVKMDILDLPGGTSYILRAQAYRVTEKGDRVMEEETRMAKSRRKPFQEMLDEIKLRLGAPKVVQPANP